MNGICSLLSRCDSIVMNSNAGDEQVFLNLPKTPSPKLQSIWSFTLYNAAETVIFQVFPRIRKNLSPLTGAVGGHIECPDNRISIIGVCGHDRRAKRSSLNCSGPTRRRIREFDLLGIESPSECAVERETDSFKDDQTAACSRARSMRSF